MIQSNTIHQMVSVKGNRDTPAVNMLYVDITCRVRALPDAAVFLLLYTRRIGQILLLLSHLNQFGEFIVGIIVK